MYYLEEKMKRKRDIQGKFSLKNDDYRRVRSVRLTDKTWQALGIASECLGWTRADLALFWDSGKSLTVSPL